MVVIRRLIIWNDIIEWTKTNKPLNILKNNIKEIWGQDIVTGESKCDDALSGIFLYIYFYSITSEIQINLVYKIYRW